MSTAAEQMRHALGVHLRSDGRWTKPYRNYFDAGDDNVPVWRALVKKGMASVIREASYISGDRPVFEVTDAGREHALAGIVFKRRYGYGMPSNP